VGSDVGSGLVGSLELGGGSLGNGAGSLVDDGSLVPSVDPVEVSVDGSLEESVDVPSDDGVDVASDSTGGASPKIATISSLNASSWAEISVSE
jgi:hypothetical protein